jgi:hypothetical protein
MRSASSLPARRVWSHLRTPVVVGGVLVVLVALARWGGAARPGPLFAAGIALLSGLILAFGALAWWLYLSPVPTQVSPARSTSLRQLLAALTLISGVLFVVGTFWDETWHRTYGSFGDDFLWSPHKLIYGSLALIMLFAGGGLIMILRGGDLRLRLRAEPLIGLLALVSAFLIASIPSDLIWHQIYGSDITSWSLPHLMLVSGVAAVLLATIALQLSFVEPRPWRGLRGLGRAELLALLGCVGATAMLLQFGTADWENLANARAASAMPPVFWERPAWLYPVMVVSAGLFCGNLAIHALRRAGAATLVALTALGFRLALLATFGAGRPEVGMGFTANLLIVPALLVLDLWYALRKNGTPATVAGGNLLAGALFLAAGLPLIDRMLAYPRVGAATLPGMIVMSLTMAMAAGWAGAQLGAWLGALDRPAAALRPSPWARRGAAALLAAAALFVVLFIITAQPPAAS